MLPMHLKGDRKKCWTCKLCGLNTYIQIITYLFSNVLPCICISVLYYNPYIVSLMHSLILCLYIHIILSIYIFRQHPLHWNCKCKSSNIYFESLTVVQASWSLHLCIHYAYKHTQTRIHTQPHPVTRHITHTHIDSSNQPYHHTQTHL